MPSAVSGAVVFICCHFTSTSSCRVSLNIYLNCPRTKSTICATNPKCAAGSGAIAVSTNAQNALDLAVTRLFLTLQWQPFYYKETGRRWRRHQIRPRLERHGASGTAHQYLSGVWLAKPIQPCVELKDVASFMKRGQKEPQCYENMSFPHLEALLVSTPSVDIITYVDGYGRFPSRFAARLGYGLRPYHIQMFLYPRVHWTFATRVP
jgi:hypothetical protein